MLIFWPLVSNLLKMADLTDMTLESFGRLMHWEYISYDEKNNLNGNFDELSAISGHLEPYLFVTTKFWSLHNHALDTLLLFENNQSADVLKAVL